MKVIFLPASERIRVIFKMHSTKMAIHIAHGKRLMKKPNSRKFKIKIYIITIRKT